MKASVFIATSLDGFIARANDDLDWLPSGGGEPHGYDEFIATVDALVIGRRTFDKVLTFGQAVGHTVRNQLLFLVLAHSIQFPRELTWKVCRALRPKSQRYFPLVVYSISM
jgi:dihydrofolate reductase